MVTRRQMLVGGLVALGALAMPTPLLDMVPGVGPREAHATGQAYIQDNRYFVILADEDQSYCLVAWSGSTDSYMRVGTYPLDQAGTDKFWLAKCQFAHQYSLQNFYTGTWLDRCNGEYNNGTWVGVYAGNGSYSQKWWVDLNNNGCVSFIGAQADVGDNDARAIDTNGLGASCILWDQNFEDGKGMGSKNVRQRWWLRYADYYFDVNPDDNKYGTSYSNGARVKSFDLKARVGSKQTYSATSLEDYNRRDLYGAVYELSNVTFREGYRYKNCNLSQGTLRASAGDGTSFTVKHDVWDDIALSINTEPIPFNLDVTFDGDKYGKTYSLGARVKSFDMKVTLDGTVTYNKKGLEDYDREDGFNCTYEITNVVYRDDYVYAGCTLSAGTLVSKAATASLSEDVRTAKDEGLATQRWTFKQNANGSYSICSKADESLCVNVWTGIIQNGQQIKLWNSTADAASQWALDLYAPSAKTNLHYLDDFNEVYKSDFVLRNARDNYAEILSMPASGWTVTNENGHPVKITYNGVITEPAEFTIMYRDVADLNGRAIDIQIDLTVLCADRLGLIETDRGIYTTVDLKIKNGTNFFGGVSVSRSPKYTIKYSVLDHATGDLISMKGAWMTAGSLSGSHCGDPCNAYDYVKANGIFPGNGGEGIVYMQQTGTVEAYVTKTNKLCMFSEGAYFGREITDGEDVVGGKDTENYSVAFVCAEDQPTFWFFNFDYHSSCGFWSFPLMMPMGILEPGDPEKSASIQG